MYYIDISLMLLTLKCNLCKMQLILQSPYFRLCIQTLNCKALLIPLLKIQFTVLLNFALLPQQNYFGYITNNFKYAPLETYSMLLAVYCFLRLISLSYISLNFCRAVQMFCATITSSGPMETSQRGPRQTVTTLICP